VATVEVQRMNEGAPYEFQVTVKGRDGDSPPRDAVRGRRWVAVRRRECPRPTSRPGGYLRPEGGGEQRILRAFDLTIISRSFPACEREIAGRL
jgi:hypothetical protein